MLQLKNTALPSHKRDKRLTKIHNLKQTNPINEAETDQKTEK